MKRNDKHNYLNFTWTEEVVLKWNFPINVRIQILVLTAKLWYPLPKAPPSILMLASRPLGVTEELHTSEPFAAMFTTEEPLSGWSHSVKPGLHRYQPVAFHKYEGYLTLFNFCDPEILCQTGEGCLLNVCGIQLDRQLLFLGFSFILASVFCYNNHQLFLLKQMRNS